MLVVLLMVPLCFSCHTRVPTRNRIIENNFPRVVLWAWERPEDLEFLNPQRFAVAFLAQTLILQGDDIVYRPRRQPLRVSSATKLIAVTRIESQKTTGNHATQSSEQRAELVSYVLRTLELRSVSAIQIDFDVIPVTPGLKN